MNYLLSGLLFSEQSGLLLMEAIQNSKVKAETKYGNIPYSVSELECEFLSTAVKTVMQNIKVRAYNIIPITDDGTYIHPDFLNH